MIITTILQSLTLSDYAITKYKEAKQIDAERNIQQIKFNDDSIKNKINSKGEKTLRLEFKKIHKKEKNKIKIKRKNH